MADQAGQQKRTSTQEQQPDGNQPQGGTASPDGNQPQGGTASPDGNQPQGGTASPDGSQSQGGEGEGGQYAGQKQQGGNKGVALQKERERRKRLEQELSRLRQAGVSAKSQGEGGGSEGPQLTEEDLDDPEALRKKVDQYIDSRLESETERLRSELAASQENSSQVDELFDQYEVFNLDDPIAEDATRAAADAIRELPDDAGTDAAERVVAEVAQRFDRYRAKQSQKATGTSEETGGNEGPAPVGAGSGETAHLQPQPESAGSINAAAKKAKELSRGLRRNRGA